MVYNLSMFSKPKLLLPEEYVNDAILHINRASSQIHLLTTIMMYDDETIPLFEALIAAANRNVHVEVVGDMFSYMERFGQYRIGMPVRNHLQPLKILRNRLRRAGVKFIWLGDKANSIVTGRTHSKWLVIDDVVYSFGGVNLSPDGLSSADYMIRLKNIGLASAIVAEQARIIKANKQGHPYRSHQIEDGENTILIDGGFVGRSIIYNEACNLAKQSRRVIYVSQYCPSGKLGKLLKATDTTFYFNPLNKAVFLNRAAIWLGSLLSGIKTSYSKNVYIHAKCIIFELKDGKKVALSGSHNFSNGGVWLGTREICLKTSDPEIVKLLEQFVEENIA